MIIPIQSPSDPMFAPAANELFIADSWITSLAIPPVFSYELRVRVDENNFIPLSSANVSMTEAQWAKWPEDADDEQYITQCVLDVLGFQSA